MKKKLVARCASEVPDKDGIIIINNRDKNKFVVT